MFIAVWKLIALKIDTSVTSRPLDSSAQIVTAGDRFTISYEEDRLVFCDPKAR